MLKRILCISFIILFTCGFAFADDEIINGYLGSPWQSDGAGGATISGSVTVGGTGVINQPADSQGLEIYGYDDKSASYLKVALNSNGNPEFVATGRSYFNAVGLLSNNTMTLGSSNEFHVAYNSSTGMVELGQASVIGAGVLVNADTSGNLLIGGTDAGTGGSKALIFGLGTFPTGLTDAAGIYAKDVSTSGEMFAQGEDTTESQISAHAGDAPDWMYDDSDLVPPQISRELNYVTGYIRYQNNTRKARLVEMMINGEALPSDPQKKQIIFTETFAEHNARTGEALVQRNWADIQEQIRLKRIDEVATAEAKISELAASIESEEDAEKKAALIAEKAGVVVPDYYAKKEMPKKLKRIVDAKKSVTTIEK